MATPELQSLLHVRNLKMSYGGIQALRGVDLDVAHGELIALIGSNGAGKTTLLKVLAGLLQPASGTVYYRGTPLIHHAAHHLVQEGLTLVPEGRGIFARLTVKENLQMGSYCRSDEPSIDRDMQNVYELFPRLFERHRQLAGTLSGGEQQMLALGRALMSRPTLLMLDEPSMGLAPMMVTKIFETIQEISARGVSILLVEQNAKLALEVAQRGYVLENGLITSSDSAAKLLVSPAVRQAYMGS